MLKGYCVISDYSQAAIKMLESIGIDFNVTASDKRPDEDELKKLVQEYDILIIGAREKMTSAVYNCATKLKILGTLSIGMDHIAKEFLDSKKIKVFNCPKSNVISVAEHTFGLILALQKKITEGNNAVIRGNGRNGINGLSHDLFGKKIGVIGAGKIATEVVNFAKTFHMELLGFTFNPQRHFDLKYKGVKFVELETLLRESDIVSVHLPLSELSERLINAEKINIMKESAIFINTSREQIVDTRYLIEHADKYSNFRVGLDIDVDGLEDIVGKYRDNVLITPHIAGVSLEAIIRMDTELADSITNYIKFR